MERQGEEKSRRRSWLVWILVLGFLGGGLLAIDRLLARAPVAVEGATLTEGKPPERQGGLARLWRGLGGGATARAPGEEASTEAPNPPPTPTTPLLVRVIGPEGPGPAAGATVFLDDQPQGITDERGELELAFPLDGKRYDAWAERGDARAEAYFLWESELPPGALTLVLRGSGSLRGLLLEASGAPVPGVEIGIRPRVTDPVTTGAEGAFDFGVLPEGGYRLEAKREDQRAETWVVLRPGEEQEVTLTLGRVETITGKVVDQDGQPLPGMTVQEQVINALATTDAEGRFEMRTRRLPALVMIMASDSNHLGRYTGHRRQDLTIVAPRLSTLTVVAAYPDGRPAADAMLEARLRNEEGVLTEFAELARTSAEGTFRAEGMLPGLWQLGERGHSKGARGDLARIELGVGEDRSLEVTVPAGEGEVRGRVIDRLSRAPLLGARVMLAPNLQMIPHGEGGLHTRAVYTDAAGAFSFSGVHPEDRVVMATAEGHRPGGVEVTSGAEILLALEADRRVRGQVVDESLLPLMDFLVDGRALTASDGTFDRSLPVSQRRLTVGARGRGERLFELPEGPEDVDLGQVVLPETRATRIRVLDPSGMPALGAIVVVHEEGQASAGVPPSFRTPGTGRDGWTQLRLPVGAYHFQATHPRHAPSPRTGPARQIEGGETLELRLQVGSWVHGSAGGPGRLVYAKPGNAETRSSPDGSYRVGPIQGYGVTLALVTEGEGQWPKHRETPELPLTPGEDLRYDFDDPAHGGIRVESRRGSFGSARLIPLTGPGAGEALFSRQIHVPLGLGFPLFFEGLSPGPYRLEIDLDAETGEDLEIPPREVEVVAGPNLLVDLDGD